MKSSIPFYCRLVLVVAAMAGGRGEIHAQAGVDLPFNSGSTGADGPLRFPPPGPSSQAHAMAFDSIRKEVVALMQNGETWKWDATNWFRVLTATNPSPRAFATMVYDEARQQVVLFGGTGAGARETWIWNGTAWSNRTELVLTPDNAPSARAVHTMVYDSARQETVLFGGQTGGHETWIWNGNSWRLAATTGPSARAYHAMAYDRLRQRTVLFDGQGSPRDTWEWDGTNWANRTAAIVTDVNTPPSRYGHAMAYDANRRRTVMFDGSLSIRDTWEWDGTNWFNRTPITLTPYNSPSGRVYAGMTYDTVRQQVMLHGGSVGETETWFWMGDRWSQWGGATFVFDMTGRPGGQWNYTTIEVGTNVTVKFAPNANNTPLHWLATSNVTVSGFIDLSGENAQQTSPFSRVAPGGPGGFAGGMGALATNQSGSATGSPGDGPGGGAPGTSDNVTGQDGRYASVYGNPYLQPLIGGSGGGGGASVAASHGGSGGGGGGAILISSSRDIAVHGQINANGGSRSSIASSGGFGSGGAIFLKADRISGGGSLRATGSGGPATEGRIRLEAYYRQLAGATTPTSVNSLPVVDQALTNNAVIRIVSVDGVLVPPSPGGNTLVPDVIFTNLNPVSISVSATSIPNNTPVRLRVATGTGVILATNILTGNSTVFSVAVPPGIGSVQAFADFAIGN